jgi:hypothetical protein
MREYSQIDIFESLSTPHYRLRVRGSAFLWGSAGIAHDIVFDKPLILHVRNDPTGDPLKLETVAASGTRHAIGTLGPGECVSLSIQKITGIAASCKGETMVGCIIQP